MNEWKKWFDSRLDNAIEMTEIETQIENAESMQNSIITISFLVLAYLDRYSRMIVVINDTFLCIL